MDGDFNTDYELVSICVITYNSAETVKDTLDSIVMQTYPKLELIISDDCSKDDTVIICKNWIEDNCSRFINIRLIEHSRNGGVAKNANSAYKTATGEWIKSIAGDDLLLPTCVADNIAYIRNNDNVDIVFSNVQVFTENDGKKEITKVLYPTSENKKIFSYTVEKQYEALLTLNFIPSVTLFVKRQLIVSKPYLEQYRFCEDWPYFLHLTQDGVRLHYFDKITVLYRLHNSLMHSASNVFFNARYHESLRDFFFAERYQPLVNLDPVLAERTRKEFILGEIAILAFKNHKNFFSRVVLYLMKKIMNVDVVR